MLSLTIPELSVLQSFGSYLGRKFLWTKLTNVTSERLLVAKPRRRKPKMVNSATIQQYVRRKCNLQIPRPSLSLRDQTLIEIKF